MHFRRQWQQHNMPEPPPHGAVKYKRADTGKPAKIGVFLPMRALRLRCCTLAPTVAVKYLHSQCYSPENAVQHYAIQNSQSTLDQNSGLPRPSSTAELPVQATFRSTPGHFLSIWVCVAPAALLLLHLTLATPGAT
jgi:hypothetical protein